jgi:hydroxyacylglutathione hydrolase
VILKQFWNEQVQQYSYLVGCPGAGEAIVIDADRNVEQYIAAAAAERLRIVHVTETHIHADYLSGSRELAQRTGSNLWLSAEGGPDWQYTFTTPEHKPLRDGDTIQIGGVTVQVWHTPGHTPEHISFLIHENGVLQGAMTGDFIFVGDVGRPDLLENAANMKGTAEPGARRLFQSVQRFAALPDHILIWPAHGVGSACGKSLGGVPVTTLGYEKATGWAWRISDENKFVEEVLAGQPEPPFYFKMMKHLNKVGPDPRPAVDALPRSSSLAEFEAARQRGAVVLDVRPSAMYLREHIRGSLHIPIYAMFAQYVGWLVDFQEEVILIASDEASAKQAATYMAYIGWDRATMWFGEDILRTYERAGHELVTTADLQACDVPKDAVWIDVRGRNERLGQNIPDAVGITLGEMVVRKDEIPQGKRLAISCQGGTRSPIGVSVAERLGHDVLNVRDGYLGFLTCQGRQKVSV